MNITHILRGSEYLSSTPKFVHLYKAFNWEIPVFIHLPLVVKNDGSKISKRNGDAMFDDMISDGYLPEAILNYTIMLGWSPGDEREFFTMAELETEFTITGISKSPSTLDYDKLKWMNGEYIRKMSVEQFSVVAKPWIEKALMSKKLDIVKISGMLQKRTDLLGDITRDIDFLVEVQPIEPELYFHKKMKSNVATSKELLPFAYKALEDTESWAHDGIYKSLVDAAAQCEVKNGKIMWPVRVALTGKAVTPGGAIDIADILGKEETLSRLKSAMIQLEEYNG